MNRLIGRSLCAAAPLLAVAQQAHAHIAAVRLGDFYSGALHPLTDLQDVVLWTALGLLAGTLGASKARWLVLALPLGLIAGLACGLKSGVSATAPVLDAAMMVTLGLLLATGIRLPAIALWVVALGLAIVRGIANAGGVGPQTNAVLFGAGLAVAGYAAITLIMALTLVFYGPGVEAAAAWRKIALRACGSWIAAIGLMMGGFALAS
jgi:urease accessory protein